MLNRLKLELDVNHGKISLDFLQREVAQPSTMIEYTQLTPRMRVCVITLGTGHEVIGVAQVLDVKNDVEAIGNKVAFDNAVNELWGVFGNIALVIKEGL